MWDLTGSGCQHTRGEGERIMGRGSVFTSAVGSQIHPDTSRHRGSLQDYAQTLVSSGSVSCRTPCLAGQAEERQPRN